MFKCSFHHSSISELISNVESQEFDHVFFFLCSNRQSIDMYSSVQSPNLSFLGTPTLSRLSNSFLTASFRGKPPEIISGLIKPLLPTTAAAAAADDEGDRRQQQHEDGRKSSQYLLPPRRPSSLQKIPEDQKPLVVGHHEVGPYRQCTYTQGVLNGMFWVHLV